MYARVAGGVVSGIEYERESVKGCSTLDETVKALLLENKARAFIFDKLEQPQVHFVLIKGGKAN